MKGLQDPAAAPDSRRKIEARKSINRLAHGVWVQIQDNVDVNRHTGVSVSHGGDTAHDYIADFRRLKSSENKDLIGHPMK